METSDVSRKGIINQGAFFSPYYLFDLLARQHADELDPEGREANRRLLRRPFRAAWARYGETGSTPGQAWQSWHRELFEALGFLGDPEGGHLRSLDAPFETPRHGLVPISHAAFADGDEAPAVLVDLHGFGTELDRAYYPDPGAVKPGGHITEEPIARAIEFALDHNEARWAVVAAGDRLRLYRKGGSVARQYLEVRFPALFDADRNDEWAAFWGLFRYQAFLPDPETGKCLLDRVLEESQRHASRIADDLRESVVLAVEALIQGVLDDPANRSVLGQTDQTTVKKLFVESLYFLYRLLFILYAESRDLLPVGESQVYREAYSVEHLREMAERPLHAEDADKTYYIETLRALSQMLHRGFPTPGSALNPGFEIPPFNGQLFDPRRTALLDRCRVSDRATRQVIRELSLSRPRRRSDRRERYSYADLGVDQLGSIYEGLLVYEPTVVTEDTVVAKVKGEERLVSQAQAEEYSLEIVEGSEKRPGSFVLRLWGGRRKGTGSYYTPAEITSFLVKEALEPLVEPIIQGCAERDKRDRPRRRPAEILELKVCDPAMGSGAFLIQTCRYLAEAYGRARVAAGLDEDERISQDEFAQYKRRVAETCLYGVDLNPLAVELAKVSLWLETLARDRPLTFLDAHLRCGNSLIGAPLRDDKDMFTVERLSYIPDEALQEVSREATKEQKAAARERIKRNRIERARIGRGSTPQMGMWDQLYADAIQQALADTLTRRLDLETSDEDLPLADAVELVATKEQLFDELLHAAESRYRQAKKVCDLWCAVWLWPEVGTEIEAEQDGQRYAVIAPEPPTTQIFLELAGGILGTDSGSLSEDEREALLLIAEHAAQEQRFFHCELEFPEVWREKSGRPKRNGGFDALVSNPPWEIVKPNSPEFWSNYDPLFRSLKKQEALRFTAKMRVDPAIDVTWRIYERNIAQHSAYLKTSGQYVQQGRGDINTYKLFLERSFASLRHGGHLSVVLPSGFYTDQGSAELRELLIVESTPRFLLSLENTKGIFPIHRQYKIVLLGLEKGPASDVLPCAFFTSKDLDGTERAPHPSHLPSLLSGLEAELLRLSTRSLRRFAPDTLSLMEFKNQREVDIVGQLYEKHPLIGKELSDSWNVTFSREFDMTLDSDLFHDREWLNASGKAEQGQGRYTGQNDERFLPLYEGKTVHQYTSNWTQVRRWLSETEAYKKLEKMAVYEDGARHYLRPRVVFRGVSNAENERTSIWTMIPSQAFCEALLPVSCDWPRPTALENLFIVGVGNSFCFDYALRLKITNRVNNFYLRQMPMPRPNDDNAILRRVAELVTDLICTDGRFADLWDDVAKRYPKAMPAQWQLQHAATDPSERAQFRAEIDALVTNLFGLSEEDFAYILTTFPLLDRDQPALPGEPKSFITRDLALLALFKLRDKTPPADIVAFFAGAGADISGITGPIHDLEQRVVEATQLGAAAYIPSGRGDDAEVEPEDVAVQLALFEECSYDADV